MKDYRQTDKGDLDLSTGDLVVVDSIEQHQRDILLADKGHYRSNPDLGVGAHNFLSDNDPEYFLREVKKELTADGMIVERVIKSDNEIEIDAEYESDSER